MFYMQISDPNPDNQNQVTNEVKDISLKDHRTLTARINNTKLSKQLV